MLVELNFSLSFINNSGLLAGDDIYGGKVDNCDLLNRNISSTSLAGIFLNDPQVTIEHENTTLLSISSDPVQVCLLQSTGNIVLPKGQ